MKKRISFDYYILLFFSVSFFGWLWEVCIYLVRERKFVNRGILTGPWLPVYGAGALFLYFFLYKLLLSEKKLFDRKKYVKPFAVFLISMTVCSALEDATGYVLMKMWGVRWWDYSGMFLDLDGHICLMSCLMFGFGGVFLIFFVFPVYTALYVKIPVKTRTILAFTLLLLFVMDAAYSADFPNAGRGITYRG